MLPSKERDKGRIYLVMEFCAGGDLSSLLRRVRTLPEASVRSFMRQLASGMRELRAHNLIHRDLKPQNLLLSEPGPNAVLKIADFGFARNLQPQGGLHWCMARLSASPAPRISLSPLHPTFHLPALHPIPPK